MFSPYHVVQLEDRRSLIPCSSTFEMDSICGTERFFSSISGSLIGYGYDFESSEGFVALLGGEPDTARADADDWNSPLFDPAVDGPRADAIARG